MKSIPKIDLPEGVIASDLNYPKWSSKDQLNRTVGDNGYLQFNFTTSFGWCLATLGIARGRNGNADRTYGVRVSDGAQIRMGQGPHILKSITVYVRTSRSEKLKKLSISVRRSTGTGLTCAEK